jgi:hypothetical protein
VSFHLRLLCDFASLRFSSPLLSEANLLCVFESSWLTLSRIDEKRITLQERDQLIQSCKSIQEWIGR